MRADQPSPGFFMFRHLSIPVLLVLSLLLPSTAPAQNADDSRPASKDTPPPAPPPAPAQTDPKPSGEAFVDRDGDGIHDGMEHRFRKQRHGKRKKGNQDAPFQHQYRNRKGKSGT